MITYADPQVCVSCRAALTPGRPDCSSCGVVLTGPVAGRLFGVLAQADVLVRQLRVGPAPAVAAPRPAPPVVVPPLAPPPVRSGVRASSVPAILLGVGALCLLVAAVIFLAVAWSWLGVGGRTAVLVTLTGLGLAASPWLYRRGLVVAAESLVTVTLGLVTLDVFGAENAGWLGAPDPAVLLVLVGLALAAASTLVLALERRLVAPQLAGVLGLVLVLLGVQELIAAPLATGVAGIAAFGAVAVLARHLRILVAAGSAVVAAAACWMGVAALGLHELGEVARPTFATVWLDGPGWALAVCAVLLGAVALVPRLDQVVGDLALAAAASTVTALLALPVADEGATAVGVASLAAGLVWLAVLVPLARARPVVGLVPAALSLAPAALLLVVLLGEAALRTLTAGSDLRLADAEPIAHPGLVPATLLVLLGALAALVRDRRALPEAGLALALGAIATLALAPVPLWTVTAALCTTAAGYVATTRLAWPGAAPYRYLGAIAVACLALTAATPSDGLLLGTTTFLVALAALGQVAGGDPVTRGAGAILLPLSASAAVWAGGAVLDADLAVVGIPAMLVVAAMALLRPRPDTEGSALLAGTVSLAVAVVAADDVLLSLAIHLTVAGALLSLTALVHPHRRPVGWAGSAVLMLALWVRLADVGVLAPEAYTLAPRARARRRGGAAAVARPEVPDHAAGSGAGARHHAVAAAVARHRPGVAARPAARRCLPRPDAGRRHAALERAAAGRRERRRRAGAARARAVRRADPAVGGDRTRRHRAHGGGHHLGAAGRGAAAGRGLRRPAALRRPADRDEGAVSVGPARSSKARDRGTRSRRPRRDHARSPLTGPAGDQKAATRSTRSPEGRIGVPSSR